MKTSGEPRLRVLCVDDNDLVSDALRRLIEADPSLEWVGVVRDGASAFGRVLDTRPDVVLMDIDIPGQDTFAIVERLAASAPDVRVVMFSGHIDPRYIERAMDSGAWGYLSKNDDVAAILDGIRRVGAGEIVLSKDVQTVQHSEWSVPNRPGRDEP